MPQPGDRNTHTDTDGERQHHESNLFHATTSPGPVSP
jgi:hypothetical protein